MPMEIVKNGDKFSVKNIKTGKTYGKTTKPKAEAQKRFLDMIMKKSKK